MFDVCRRTRAKVGVQGVVTQHYRVRLADRGAAEVEIGPVFRMPGAVPALRQRKGLVQVVHVHR